MLRLNPGEHIAVSLNRHREFGTGLRPTSLDETDFVGVQVGAIFGLSARGRSLSDAVKLVRELDPGRFDDLDLRQERQRSEACFLGFRICKAPSPAMQEWRRPWKSSMIASPGWTFTRTPWSPACARCRGTRRRGNAGLMRQRRTGF